MSAQKSITSYFNSRKRSAANSTPTRSKLLIQEAEGQIRKIHKTLPADDGVLPGFSATAHEGPSTTQKEPAKPVRSLSLEELKNKIQAKGAAREKLKNSLKKFQDLDEKLTIKPFEKPLEFELPESPIKKPAYLSPLKSPCKSPLKSASPSKARVKLNFEGEKQDLPLPQSYEGLYASFKAMVGVACMLENRKEMVTLSKVSSGVELVTRTAFGREKLAQIKSVDPESVECKLLNDNDLELKVKFSKDAQGKAWASLTLREESFRLKLLNLVKKFHQEFLQQLNPPIHVEPDQVRRWHPDFEPNLVPEIKPAALPENTKSKVYTASEILEANSFLKNNKRVAEALSKLKTEDEEKKEEATEPLNPSLRGLPASLLAKVRQKQAERARLASLSIVRPSEEQQRRRQLERLPALAKYVRNVFVSQKKNVLRLDLLLDKLDACFPCRLARAELEQHLDMIHAAAPHWLSKYVERQVTVVRIDKDAQLDCVLKILEKMLD
ncbi:DNA replication factor Cdt1 [Cloeon dipterum]|uniref:DNA replication factor Cdt1 n=1 Tax=Cloeon dipterum TaxID=197152 RepID=UPI00321F8DE9